jgi:hypothetical protein
MSNIYFDGAVLPIAGKALLNSIKTHKLLLEKVDTIELYRDITGLTPLVGGVVYITQNGNDGIDDALEFISDISEIYQIHSSKLIDSIIYRSDELPLSLFNSITGFLEESVDAIKKELDISSENSWDNFWQHFDFSQTDNKCIQLLYTMTVVDLVRGVFNELFYIIGGNHYEANEEAHHKVLAKTISIMLDITPESVSEMLDGDLVNDLKINPKDFTLHDGIEGLMDHHRLVRS